VTIRQLAELVQDRFEARTGHRPALHAPPAEGPAPEPYQVDLSRLDALGLRPTTPLVEAVDEIAGFCLARKDAFSQLSNNPR
jgi:nucleoside-diphosphate-sugar epimerase